MIAMIAAQIPTCKIGRAHLAALRVALLIWPR
jgi:hypothetical protein